MADLVQCEMQLRNLRCMFAKWPGIHFVPNNQIDGSVVACCSTCPDLVCTKKHSIGPFAVIYYAPHRIGPYASHRTMCIASGHMHRIGLYAPHRIGQYACVCQPTDLVFVQRRTASDHMHPIASDQMLRFVNRLIWFVQRSASNHMLRFVNRLNRTDIVCTKKNSIGPILANKKVAVSGFEDIAGR